MHILQIFDQKIISIQQDFKKAKSVLVAFWGLGNLNAVNSINSVIFSQVMSRIVFKIYVFMMNSN